MSERPDLVTINGHHYRPGTEGYELVLQLSEQRERIAAAMSEEFADRVTWDDGTEYISVADAQRIARDGGVA